MSTTIWSGATNGDLNDATNWSGIAPITDDVAIIQGAVSIDTDMATLTAVDLDLLYVDENYTGNIGGSGNALDISADQVIFRGSGEFWYKDGGGTTDLIIIDAASPDTIVNIDGDLCTTVIVLRGTVTIASGIGVIALLEVGYSTNRYSDATVNVVAGASAITAMRQWGGNATVAKTNSAMELIDGILTQNTGAITLHSQYGGRCVYNTGTAMGVGSCLYGGELDLTESHLEKTISGLRIYPGAVYKKIDALTTDTLTYVREPS